jgi:hypothetical protein
MAVWAGRINTCVQISANCFRALDCTASYGRNLRLVRGQSIPAGFDFRVLFGLPFWTSKKVTDAPVHYQVASHLTELPIFSFDMTIPVFIL